MGNKKISSMDLYKISMLLQYAKLELERQSLLRGMFEAGLNPTEIEALKYRINNLLPQKEE